jgi:hypothetical protein
MLKDAPDCGARIVSIVHRDLTVTEMLCLQAQRSRLQASDAKERAAGILLEAVRRKEHALRTQERTAQIIRANHATLTRSHLRIAHRKPERQG